MLTTIAALLLTTPAAPVFERTCAVRQGEHVRLVFEVSNPNPDPMPYVGYTADSFAPKILSGTIGPIDCVEVLRGTEWTAHPIGWCGTGIGPVAIPGRAKVTFAASVPAGGWEEVRLGLTWFPVTYGKGPRVAWSSAIDRKQIKPAK